MSRSYRKNPVLTDNGCSKQGKRIANGIVRAKLRTGKYDSGLRVAGYKRMTESWNICDYAFRKDVSEARRDGQAWGEYKRVWLAK